MDINSTTRNNQSSYKHNRQQPASRMPTFLHHIRPQHRHKTLPHAAKHRGRPCKPYDYLVNRRAKLKKAICLLQDWAITKNGFDQLKTDLWYVGVIYCKRILTSVWYRHSHYGDGPITKGEKLFQQTTKTLEKIAGNAIKLVQQMPPGRLRNEIIGQLSNGIKTSEVARTFKVGLSTILRARKCGKKHLKMHRRQAGITRSRYRDVDYDYLLTVRAVYPTHPTNHVSRYLMNVHHTDQVGITARCKKIAKLSTVIIRIVSNTPHTTCLDTHLCMKVCEILFNPRLTPV